FGLGASAQTKFVKEVERNTKKNYSEAVKQMQPAFTNPETANDAYPRYVVGKAGFDQFDEFFGKKQLGMPVDDIQMSDALMGGYEYMQKALALDTIVDAKGKVKTKYSKDAINTIAGHFVDYSNAAVYYWAGEKYKNAFDAWQVYVDVSRDPRFVKHIEVPVDTMMQNIVFNQALAAYNMQDMKSALNKFLEAMDIAPAKKQVYDYALSVAQQLDSNDTIIAICEKAIPLYGNEDSMYLINIINVYNKKGDFANADRMIDEAIAKDGSNAQLWRVKGYLQEYQEHADDAIDSYKKAVEINPEFTEGLYDYARSIYNKGMRIEDATSQAHYGRD
ncbi:MAG: tetratricopeptide repeat protein, partial [Muribaculaceae bacterium]|nr:tetratricopeptide repeat protein [Muribaculaceae bacterium]